MHVALRRWLLPDLVVDAAGPLFAVHAISCTLSELLCNMHSQALGLVGESCETKLAQPTPMKKPIVPSLSGAKAPISPKY